jgi:hypothetical protein
MSEPNLVGHSILVVEPEIDQFALNLQAALEARGAETLVARNPAKAFEGSRALRFSACLLNYDHASDGLHALINYLSDIPILLYGGERASTAASRMMPHLAFTDRTVDSIVDALGKLLQSARH